MLVCGIDPGNNGAVCVLDSSNPTSPALLDFYKSSTYDIATWIHQQNPDVIWIEELHSIYHVTAKSNFGLGRSVGIVLSIAEIIKKGHSLVVDYSLTLSCYNPTDSGLACGKCDSCKFRKEGFKDAGLPDPTKYK